MLIARPGRRLAAAFSFMVLAGGPRAAVAQSASQLGAWDAIMLSPVGALAPVARDADANAAPSELTLRYGRWRYDAEDAVHNTIGLTYAHSLGFANTQVALTGAYLIVACSICSKWEMGGVDLQSTLWTRDISAANRRPITAGVGLRASLGGARYGGPEGATAASGAVTLPISIALPFKRTSLLCASIVPGFGTGRIASADLAERGSRPMIGAAVSWTLTSKLGIDLGMQRVIISRGPTQLGAGFSWNLRSSGDAPR
jgi:hypothetical protein